MGTSGLAEKAAQESAVAMNAPPDAAVVVPDAGRSRQPRLLALSRVLARAVGQAARRHADDAGAARPRAALGPDRGAVDRGGGADLPAAVAPAQPARRRRAGAARRHQPLPRPPRRPRALHPRHRRFGGGRQEHDGARAARAAGALGRSSARRSHHHRRLPASQCGARAPRPDGPQGLSRKLRHGAAAELPARREVGQGQRRSAGLFALPLRHHSGPDRRSSTGRTS